MPFPRGPREPWPLYLKLHSPACSQPERNRLAPGQAQATESLSEGGLGNPWLPWCLTWVLSCLSQVWPDLRAFPLGDACVKAWAKGLPVVLFPGGPVAAPSLFLSTLSPTHTSQPPPPSVDPAHVSGLLKRKASGVTLSEAKERTPSLKVVLGAWDAAPQPAQSPGCGAHPGQRREGSVTTSCHKEALSEMNL